RGRVRGHDTDGARAYARAPSGITPGRPWYALREPGGPSLMARGLRPCEYRDVTTAPTQPRADHHTRQQPPPDGAPPRFVRRSDGGLLGGVASGLAAHLGLEPLVVRVGFALLTAFAGFGAVLYVALWVFTPLDQ